MRFQFIGSGDAFGSGGRLNTCFHVEGERSNFLIDLGASSLIGLKARAVDRNAVRTIFVTHFHADHFGGIPFFMLDAQFFSRRTQPLSIVGPKGLAHWYERVMETSFPGSHATKPRFDLELIEIAPGGSIDVADVRVHAWQALHGPSDGPFLSLRFESEGRTLAYTGDTEWTEALVAAGRHADLFVAEAYFFDKKIRYHLDLATLLENLPRIEPKRLVVTHMSDDMLGRLADLRVEAAHDGLVVLL